MKAKQLNLFDKKTQLCFGGSLLIGKRKSARPLSQKHPIHLVLKANNANLLLRNKKRVEQLITKFNRRYGVKCYEFAVQTDHVHLNVLIPNRTLYKRWIRALTSSIAREIDGLKWALRPFTRVCSWGRDFRKVVRYIKDNATESEFVLAAHMRVDNFLDLLPTSNWKLDHRFEGWSDLHAPAG